MIRRNRPKPEKPVPVWEGPKPELKMVQIPVYRVHYADLQAYLLKVYKLDCNILFLLGITHGMVPEYSVTGEKPPAWNAQQQMDNIRRGYRCRNLHLILTVLCMDGFIPKGQYILDTTPMKPAIEEYRELLQKYEDPLHEECVRFRNRHRSDRIFQEQAALMNQAVVEYKRKNTL